MKLKIKSLKISAGLPVALLDKKTADKIGVHPRGRILIETPSKKNPKNIFSIVDITKNVIGEKEIALSSEIITLLGIKTGTKIEVNLAPLPKSVNYILKKLNGKNLDKKEIKFIIGDIVNNSLSEAEIALFISAMYKQGMSLKEVVFLIDSLLSYGNKLNLKNKKIVDKHSIGGVPGNRTTPIVVSICAANGLIFPKNSSRAITSAAGTADVIESVAKIEFSIKKLKKIVEKTNACMVWGGGLNLVPADSKIISIEKMLKIDPESQLLASIMSKKLAVGSKYILIDIPYGKGAKVSKKKALSLKKKFEWLGKHYNKKLKCVLTGGSKPIGRGIGPILELKDVIRVLRLDEDSPKDLRKKSIFLAGEIFELVGKSKKGEGVKLADQILNSGEAFKKFKEIIREQEGNLNRIIKSKYKKKIKSKKSGKIRFINGKLISKLARTLGCPADRASGIYLNKTVGETVKKGETIMTFYSETRSRIKNATKENTQKNPIKIY